MSLVLPTQELMKWGSVVLVGASLFVGTWLSVVDTGGPVMRLVRHYIAWLERQLRLMFIFVPGRHILAGQAFVFVTYMTLALMLGIPFWGLGLLAIAAGPAIWVMKKKQERLEAIEFQLDAFIQALANSLKSTAQIAAALSNTVEVIAEPLRSEVELVTKEMRVGSTVDQALLQMASRIGSRPVDTALSAILIGRTVGGNLPRVLESTASSLREMQRLDGVLRTKTADGRMQLWAIGAMPGVLVVGLNFGWPGYFAPLTSSLTGYMMLAGVIVFWVSAIVMARKVLAVDI